MCKNLRIAKFFGPSHPVSVNFYTQVLTIFLHSAGRTADRRTPFFINSHTRVGVRLPLQIVSITLPLRVDPATISRPLRTSTSRLFPLFLPFRFPPLPPLFRHLSIFVRGMLSLFFPLFSFLISVQYCRILSGYPFLAVLPIANRLSMSFIAPHAMRVCKVNR